MIKILLSCEVCSLIFMLVFFIFYFTKNRVKTFDNSLYNVMIIVSILGFILEIALNLSAPLLGSVLTKTCILLYVSHYIVSTILIMYYVIVKHIARTFSDEEQIEKKRSLILSIMIVYLMATVFSSMILSGGYHYDPIKQYFYGDGIDTIIATVVILITMFTDLFLFVKDYKLLNTREKVCLISIPVLYSISGVFRLINPAFTINNVINSFIVSIMFFTIEDPDAERIEELDKSSNDKEVFLDIISTELVKPLKNVVSISSIKSKDVNSLEADFGSIHDDLLIINDVVNNIDQYNNMDCLSIRSKRDVYDIKNLINGMVLKYKETLLSTGIDFNYDYETELPDKLIGNPDELKIIIDKLVSNSIKFTKRGYISLIISSEINGDLCKIMIRVRDTGVGLVEGKIEESKNEFVKDVDYSGEKSSGAGLGLSIVQRIVDSLDGKLNILSDEECGTEVIAIIFQRV